jgi:hypothetical protein
MFLFYLYNGPDKCRTFGKTTYWGFIYFSFELEKRTSKYYMFLNSFIISIKGKNQGVAPIGKHDNRFPMTTYLRRIQYNHTTVN